MLSDPKKQEREPAYCIAYPPTDGRALAASCAAVVAAGAAAHAAAGHEPGASCWGRARAQGCCLHPLHAESKAGLCCTKRAKDVLGRAPRLQEASLFSRQGDQGAINCVDCMRVPDCAQHADYCEHVCLYTHPCNPQGGKHSATPGLPGVSSCPPDWSQLWLQKSVAPCGYPVASVYVVPVWRQRLCHSWERREEGSRAKTRHARRITHRQAHDGQRHDPGCFLRCFAVLRRGFSWAGNFPPSRPAPLSWLESAQLSPPNSYESTCCPIMKRTGAPVC